MPPRPRRTSVAARRIPRRRTQWAEYSNSFVTGAIGNINRQDLFDQFRIASGDTVGTTILRIHIRIFVLSAVAAGDGFQWGLVVDKQNNVGASGAGADLDPAAFPYNDWMFIRREGAHPGYSMVGPNNQFEVDVRAKRRLHELNDTLIIAVNNTGAAASLNTYVYARILLAMP